MQNLLKVQCPSTENEKNKRVEQRCRHKTIEMRVKDMKKEDRQIYKEEKVNRFRNRIF